MRHSGLGAAGPNRNSNGHPIECDLQLSDRDHSFACCANDNGQSQFGDSDFHRDQSSAGSMAHREPRDRESAGQSDSARESDQPHGQDLCIKRDADSDWSSSGDDSGDPGGDPGTIDSDIERDHGDFRYAAKSAGDRNRKRKPS